MGLSIEVASRGVRVEVADQPDSMAAARAVFDQVWPGEGTQVTSNLLRALIHAGGYCSVVIDEDTNLRAFRKELAWSAASARFGVNA